MAQIFADSFQKTNLRSSAQSAGIKPVSHLCPSVAKTLFHDLSRSKQCFGCAFMNFSNATCSPRILSADGTVNNSGLQNGEHVEFIGSNCCQRKISDGFSGEQPVHINL
jgi:hypothetical protein